MGLRGCYSCSKYLLVVLHIIFLLFSIAGIAASIWLFIDSINPLRFAQEMNDYLIAVTIILIGSIILFIVAILGIHGCAKEVRWSIVVSASLLLIIFVAEISAGVWGYMNRDDLQLQIRTSVKRTVQQDYQKDENIRDLFDKFQSKLQCCGAEGPGDWIHGNEVNLKLSQDGQQYNIPASCCREGISRSECQKATTNIKVGSKANTQIVYDRGCYNLILEEAKNRCCILLIIGGVILGVEILALMLSLVLFFGINKSHQYKA